MRLDDNYDRYPAGAKVRCFTEKPWDHAASKSRYAPVKGGVYTVRRSIGDRGHLFLEFEDLSGWWSSWAFEVVPSSPPPLTPPGYGKDITPQPPTDYREFGSRKNEALKDKDNVDLPEHYARFKHEPVRFSMENRLDAFQFNIIKYTCRHDSKNGIEDIEKVIRYATMYKRFLLGDPDWWKASK